MVNASGSPYESARNQRVEENKRRLQELGLTDLSRDLNNSVASSRPSPGSNRGRPRAVTKEKVTIQVRRSTRNSGGGLPEYAEVEIDIRRRARFDNTGGTRHYSRLYERKYASEEARMNATEKAEALKKMLPQTNASFVKPMLQSHVTGGFWLGLPVAFCRDYLPKSDSRIVLEDEKSDEWETIYLSNKTGLSGGWRGFSLDHSLVDGDALVFELVEPKRFRVHIIRVYGTDVLDVELESDVKEQRFEALNHSKVRQKLIWVSEPERANTVEENRASDAVADTETQIDGRILGCAGANKRKDISNDDYTAGALDVKPRIRHETNPVTMTKAMACDSDGAGADDSEIDSIRANMLLDIQDGMSSKGLSSHSHDCSKVMRREMVEEENGGGKQSREREMTSYMRSRKHIDDADVKREMRSSKKGIGVCC